MVIDLIPTTPVVLSMATCAALPVVLVGLSHQPARIASPARRFAVALLVTWVAWLAAMAVTTPGWIDVVTGALLLATATIAGFTLWTLIAWGFTLSMQLALVRREEPLSLDDWVFAHTRGRPLEAFARNRLGLLTLLGLVEIRGERVVMTTGRGYVAARSAAALRRIFGLPR